MRFSPNLLVCLVAGFMELKKIPATQTVHIIEGGLEDSRFKVLQEYEDYVVYLNNLLSKQESATE